MIDSAVTSLKTTLIYSNCLHLEPEEGFIKVVAELAAWIGWKTRSYLTPDDLLSGARDYAFPDHSTLTTELLESQGATILKATYAHGDRKVDGRRWITEVVINGQSSDFNIACSVNLFVEDAHGLGKPPIQSRPRLMVNLVESCRPIGSTPGLYTKPLTLTTSEKFLIEIASPYRKAPIVVVSSNWSCEPPLDVERMREQLIGLANVYQITENTDASDLSDALGRNYTCYGDAIRVIWPVVEGESEASTMLVLAKGRKDVPRTAHEMERAAFFSVLRRHIQARHS